MAYSKAFVFTDPILEVQKEAETIIFGKEYFAPDGVTLTIESEPREVDRFTGSDKFPTGSFAVSGTIATILQSGDVWGFMAELGISGFEKTTLANGKTGIKIGDAENCVISEDYTVVLRDACATGDEKRIRLRGVNFNAESIEFAINNSDGITPEIAFYANGDADGKVELGFDDPTPEA